MSFAMQDLRFALRQQRKSWVTSVLAAVTLAVGIGSAAVMITLVYDVLLRPLSFPESSLITYISPGSSAPNFGVTSWLNYSDLRDHARAFSELAAYFNDVGAVQSGNQTLSVASVHVTSNMFKMLGTAPLLGRTFDLRDQSAGGPGVAILSYGLWRSQFHADAEIVGRTMKLNSEDVTIIGVMPRQFSFPNELGPDIGRAIWVPLRPDHEMITNRAYNFLNIIGRRRANVTLQQAEAEIATITARIRVSDPGDTQELGFQVIEYRDLLTASVQPILWALLWAVCFILLIACGNIVNVLVGRHLARQHEFALRSALGADRGRLFGHLLLEGGILCLVGTFLGFCLAAGGILSLRLLPEGTIPRADSISLHWEVVLLLAPVAILAALISSAIPALIGGHVKAAFIMHATPGVTRSHAMGRRLNNGLIVGEVALASFLLITAGLLYRSLVALEHTPLGFNTEHLSSFTVLPPNAASLASSGSSNTGSSPGGSVVTGTYAPVLNRLRHAPGVESAAFITAPPFSGVDLRVNFTILNQAGRLPGKLQSLVTAVSGDYARTMGTPMASGRMLSESDLSDSQYVAVVNEAFVSQFINGDPLRRQIVLGGKETGLIKPYAIVGVIGNQAGDNVGTNPVPEVYIPYEQIPRSSQLYAPLLTGGIYCVVRTDAVVPIAAEAMEVFHEEAPDYALDNFESMDQVIEDNIIGQRLTAYIAVGFAIISIIVITTGTYSVLLQMVGFRRREIGVRMAVGATRVDVARMVIRRGMIMIMIGLAIGALFSGVSAHLMSAFLYHVHPVDPATYLFSVMVILIIGITSVSIPAYRAASTDPIATLRES